MIGWETVNAAPHSLQNFAAGRLSWAQLGQRWLREAPHSMQNLTFSALLLLHAGQRTLLLVRNEPEATRIKLATLRH
jgi:hypothetical protein